MVEISCLTDGHRWAEHFIMEALHVFGDVGEDVWPHVDAIFSSAQEIRWFVVARDASFTVNQACSGGLATSRDRRGSPWRTFPTA